MADTPNASRGQRSAKRKIRVQGPSREENREKGQGKIEAQGPSKGGSKKPAGRRRHSRAGRRDQGTQGGPKLERRDQGATRTTKDRRSSRKKKERNKEAQRTPKHEEKHRERTRSRSTKRDAKERMKVREDEIKEPQRTGFQDRAKRMSRSRQRKEGLQDRGLPEKKERGKSRSERRKRRQGRSWDDREKTAVRCRPRAADRPRSAGSRRLQHFHLQPASDPGTIEPRRASTGEPVLAAAEARSRPRAPKEKTP